MLEKKTSAFSKNDSLCLKGLAIFLLMCIHCFGAEKRFAGFEFNFWPLGQDLYVDLAYYCKICVSIFAFISGYGLYLSAKGKANDITQSNKWVTSRIIKTLNGFWFVYVVCFIALFCANLLIDSRYLQDGMVRGAVYAFLDFLGVAGLFGTPMLNASWWYMSAAVVYVALMPLLVRWTDKLGWFSLLTVIVMIPRVLFNSDFFGATNIYSFILPVYFGALFARFEIFEAIEKIKVSKNKVVNNILLFVIGVFLVLVSIYVWIRVPFSVLWEYHFGVAPLFVIVFCNRFIFRDGGHIFKVIRVVFSFLGKHSMNVYIFHSFLRVFFLKDFIYSLKYPTLTIVTLLAISLVISVILELIKKLIRYNKFIDFLHNKILSLFDLKKKA